MNAIALTGRTTKEPELRQTQSGKDVCSFTLAVDRPGVRDTTDFINCVVWEQGARYLTTYGGKGRMVAVTGKLTQRDWEDKNGQRRTTYEVLCDRQQAPADRRWVGEQRGGGEVRSQQPAEEKERAGVGGHHRADG